MSSYKEKLLDVRWQKKRLQILDRDKFTCQSCLKDEAEAVRYGERLTLHVHHLRYSGKDPWDALDTDLVTLCAKCHEQETETMDGAAAKLIDLLKSKGMLSNDFHLLGVVFTNLKGSASDFVWDLCAATVGRLAQEQHKSKEEVQ